MRGRRGGCGRHGAPPPDSLAPTGAAHNWLPKEGWVWMHWLPFDERELASALALPGRL